MNGRHRTDLALSAGFVIFMGLIGAFALIRPADHESLARENRKPSAMPTIQGVDTLKKFPARFEAFFNDRLPFREQLLNLHALIRVEGLGVSSSPKVILGHEGWLFLDERTEGAEGRRSLWDAAFRERSEWLSHRGIDYLVVLTPEKHTVYPEHVPVANQINRDSIDDPRALDLLPALKKARVKRQVYFHSDTHWNDEGAYVAYREIVARLKLQPIPRERFVESTFEYHGDLGRMLHLEQPPAETAIALHLPNPKARRFHVEVPLDSQLHSPKYLQPQVWGTGDRTLPRGVLFHDSFSERLLLPLMAEHFELLVYAPSASIDPAVIEKFRPTIVIQQIVERKIRRHVPIGNLR